MRFLLSLFFFFWASIAFGQKIPETTIKVSLSQKSNLRVADTLSLLLELQPDNAWHVYSLINTGAYLPTTITFSENCRDVAFVGAPTEEGIIHNEYDEVMMGDVNYFEGKATLRQNVKITGKHPLILGLIHFQICSGERCVPSTLEFKIDFKAK